MLVNQKVNMSSASNLALNQAPANTNETGRSDANKMEADFANILGPSGYDQREDKKRRFRHSRLHIPDRLPEKYLGQNLFMQDRIDGLITDTTFSPFTTVILPYKYMVRNRIVDCA